MASVIIMHNVGDFDTWVSKDNRSKLMPECCESYSLFRIPGENRVAVLLEGVDMEKLQGLMGGAAGEAAMKEDTVLQPAEMFMLLEGAR